MGRVSRVSKIGPRRTVAGVEGSSVEDDDLAEPRVIMEEGVNHACPPTSDGGDVTEAECWWDGSQVDGDQVALVLGSSWGRANSEQS